MRQKHTITLARTSHALARHACSTTLGERVCVCQGVSVCVLWPPSTLSGTLPTHLHSSTYPQRNPYTRRRLRCRHSDRQPGHLVDLFTRGAAAVQPWPTRVAAPPPRSICLSPHSLPRFPARALFLCALTLSLGTHNTHQTALSFCRSLALARLRARALTLSLSLSLSTHTGTHIESLSIPPSNSPSLTWALEGSREAFITG